jgi:glycosyltransferase involved in cell wall biosynthesis
MTAPLITVALCTHDHADRLVRTLASLPRLVAPTSEWELVVIDNASRDATPEVLADPAWHPPGVRVRVVNEERLGLSNARNRALVEARGQYLAFIDDDETPDPMWLRAYEACIIEHRPDAMGGRIDVSLEGARRPSWLQDELLGFLGQLDHGPARWLTSGESPIYGGNFAFRRSVFERIGCFDARLGRRGRTNAGGEDADIYARLLAAGCAVRWVPEAIVQHHIETPKLRRGYFLELHFQQGLMEGARKRGIATRIPPRYLFRQVARAFLRALRQRMTAGSNRSLRLEMNAAYFSGFVLGWIWHSP